MRDHTSMMSTFSDAQRAKKRLTPYNKSGSQSRSQASTPLIKSTPVPSQNTSQTPSKDIYDYDFPDDDPPPPKSISKPKLPPARPSNKSTAYAASSSSPSSSATPKPLPSTQRNFSSRGALEAARGIKRKTSQADSITPGQRPSVATTPSSARKPIDVTHTRKAGQQASKSPESVGTINASSLASKTRVTAKAFASPARPRAAKTPPRDTAGLKGSTDVRSSSASPRKSIYGFPTTTPKTIRKPQTTQPTNPMPFRPHDQLSLAGNDTTPRPPARTAMTARSTPSIEQSAQRKRRRLIDTLADQMEGESSSDEDEPSQEEAGARDDDASSEADTILSKYRNIRSTSLSDDRLGHMELESIATASPGKASIAPSTPATISRRPGPRRPGIKFTYNLERTMLAEDPVVTDGPQGSDLSLLESLLPDPEPKPTAFDIDEDAGGSSQGAIQSIHELRQAGANSRFADELVDIMDRVGTPSTGKPSSARRSALIELVQKLQEKSFLRHFRDKGAETQLFQDVGKESDVISGFTIVCVMVTLLSSGLASHRLLHMFQPPKVKDFFLKLLGADTDIVTLSRDRKTNVSDHMRRQLTSLKDIMKRLPAWKPAPAAPSQLSPRTMALQALYMLSQQLQASSGGVHGIDEDGSVLSTTLTKELFDIVSSALSSPDDDDGSSPLPPIFASGLSSDAEAIDLYHALSILEMHSVAAMQSDIGAEWTRSYLPVIATALQESLQRHQKNSERLNDLELLVLKLALNTANNNPDAARYYVDKGLLVQLAEIIAVALDTIVRSAKTGEVFASDALKELLLMLGVMINFSENDTTAGQTLEQGGGLTLFNQLGKTFLDSRALAAEADSEEKSQINVAFAYLSILLGYFCLHEPIYQAFKDLSPSGNLRPLLESIHQFVMLHNQIGKAENPDHGAEASHFTTRLRALAHELELKS